MKNLFDETYFKGLKMKNRFIRGALWREMADDFGNLTPELEKVYEDLAKGGVSTIITGYSFITKEEQPNPKMLGIYDDSFIPQYKKFTDKIHKYDTNIIMQIVYGGSMTNFNTENRVIFSPSTIKNDATGTLGREISKDEIKYIINSFAESALRVKKAGFDGVEIHAGHGYLLSQFLSPFYNKRSDEYGGNIENRARIIFEIYSAMREKVGDDFPILIKLNSSDGLNNIGYTEEEGLFVAKKLSELGIDGIEVTGGNESLKIVRDNNLGAARTKIFNSIQNESYFKNFAIKLSKLIDTPIILIGGNRSIEHMEDILNNSNIQYFSLSRPLTCEPNLINRWSNGDLSKPKCISCNKCYQTPNKECFFNIR